MKKNVIIFTLLSVFILTGIPYQTSYIPIHESHFDVGCKSLLTSTAEDLTGVSVGIYEGYFTLDDRVENSRTALIHMFEWMNASVHVLNKTDILNGALWACEIFVIPEGLGPNIEWSLGVEAEDMIREWVYLGGSYIGVRGSSTIVFPNSFFEGGTESYRLALINGTSYGYPELGYMLMTELNINKSCTGPDMSDMNDTISVLFKTGRYFRPDPGQEVYPIARYPDNGEIAMLAAKIGEGTVFVSSPHFEFEEDSERDGIDEHDDFEDPESDWPLMLRICHWLVDFSPTISNTTTWTYPITTQTTTTTSALVNTTTGNPLQIPPTTIVIIGGLTSFVILAIVVILRRRND